MSYFAGRLSWGSFHWGEFGGKAQEISLRRALTNGLYFFLEASIIVVIIIIIVSSSGDDLFKPLCLVNLLVCCWGLWAEGLLVMLDSAEEQTEQSSFLRNAGTLIFCFGLGNTFIYYFQASSKRGLMKDWEDDLECPCATLPSIFSSHVLQLIACELSRHLYF